MQWHFHAKYVPDGCNVEISATSAMLEIAI